MYRIERELPLRPHGRYRRRPVTTGPRNPTIGTPQRGAPSMRRTTSIDMTFPGGLTGPVHLRGLGRDLRTDPDGRVTEVDTVALEATVDGQVVATLEVSPPVPAVDALVGAGARSGFRKHLAALPGLAGGVLHQLLDDLPGATLVSAYAPQLAVGSDDLVPEDPDGAVQVMLGMVDICAGWRAGGTPVSSVAAGGPPTLWLGPDAPPWERTDDPLAWHDLPEVTPHSMRRARRLDVRPHDADGGCVRVDVGFRDTHADGAGRVTIVHEYALSAEVRVPSLDVIAIDAAPRVLPYPECPEAAASPRRLLGGSLVGVRDRVRTEFAGPSTCTHLNDVLRSLEDVGHLASLLAHDGARPR